MIVLARSFGDFLRSSRLCAIFIGLLGYAGIVRLTDVLQDLLDWAIPAGVAYIRTKGLQHLPEISFSVPDWEVLARSSLSGLLMTIVAVTLMLHIFGRRIPRESAG